MPPRQYTYEICDIRGTYASMPMYLWSFRYSWYLRQLRLHASVFMTFYDIYDIWGRFAFMPVYFMKFYNFTIFMISEARMPPTQCIYEIIMFMIYFDIWGVYLQASVFLWNFCLSPRMSHTRALCSPACYSAKRTVGSILVVTQFTLVVVLVLAY